MKNICVLFCLFFTFTLLGCMSNSPSNLQVYEGAYFVLDKEYPGLSYQVKPKLGGPKTYPVHICKGKYESIYRDADGVYYTSPRDCKEKYECTTSNGNVAMCESNVAGGIWVSDNLDEKGNDLWFVIKKSFESKDGWLLWGLDSLEVGNIKKLWLEILSDDINSEIATSIVLESEGQRN